MLNSSAFKTPVLGIGAGGHAKVILEILRDDPRYEVAGLLDIDQELWGRTVSGISVLGDDALLESLFAGGYRHAFLGVGATGSAVVRRRLYEQATRIGYQFISAVHSKAIVSPSARVGAGAAIMAGAIINADACIGVNVIVNTGAVIEHECSIGDHSHIATGALLAGMVSVGGGSHIGAGATVRQCIRIGCNAIVGAGAVVVKDVPDDVTVAGVPARLLKAAKT